MQVFKFLFIAHSTVDDVGACKSGSTMLMIEKYIQALNEYALSHEPNFGNAKSVLAMLYECYNENNPYDNEQIKADFNELYQRMNGMSLREMDKIIYPVCTLCRDHEKTGFVEGMKIALRLIEALRE